MVRYIFSLWNKAGSDVSEMTDISFLRQEANEALQEFQDAVNQPIAGLLELDQVLNRLRQLQVRIQAILGQLEQNANPTDLTLIDQLRGALMEMIELETTLAPNQSLPAWGIVTEKAVVSRRAKKLSRTVLKK